MKCQKLPLLLRTKNFLNKLFIHKGHTIHYILCVPFSFHAMYKVAISHTYSGRTLYCVMHKATQKRVPNGKGEYFYSRNVATAIIEKIKYKHNPFCNLVVDYGKCTSKHGHKRNGGILSTSPFKDSKTTSNIKKSVKMFGVPFEKLKGLDIQTLRKEYQRAKAIQATK